MPSFRTEIRTIRLLLAGSAWAVDPQVQTVLEEYDRFLGAARLRVMERQTSLQIFYASRAFDSLLVQVVIWERTRLGLRPIRDGERTIGGTLNFVINNSINGNTFTPATLHRLRNNTDGLKRRRNEYLHIAGSFPSTMHLQQFLNDTFAGVQEIVAWR